MCQVNITEYYRYGKPNRKIDLYSMGMIFKVRSRSVAVAVSPACGLVRMAANFISTIER